MQLSREKIVRAGTRVGGTVKIGKWDSDRGRGLLQSVMEGDR